MGGAQCTTADVEAYTAAKIKQQYEVEGASSFTEEQLNSLPVSNFLQNKSNRKFKQKMKIILLFLS